MGERSQIYIRVSDDKSGRCIHIARYYQWNFGTGMVSRARGICDYILKTTVMTPEMERILPEITDADFDTRSIASGVDILREIEDEEESPENIFLQDNDDGQLLIDMPYGVFGQPFIAFIKGALPDRGVSQSTVCNAEDYLAWDRTDIKDLPPAVQRYTKRNIGWLLKNTYPMTASHAEKFRDDFKQYASELLKPF